MIEGALAGYGGWSASERGVGIQAGFLVAAIVAIKVESVVALVQKIGDLVDSRLRRAAHLLRRVAQSIDRDTNYTR